MSAKTILSLGLLGGITIFGVGAYYYYEKKSHSSESGTSVTKLDKAKVLLILKDLNKQLFPVFSQMAMMSMSIKEQLRGRGGLGMEVHEFVSSHPQALEQIKQVEERIYQKHGTTEKSFRNACETSFKDDLEVKRLMDEIKKQFDQSAKGSIPENNAEIPQFLTAEKTLQILKKMFQETSKRIQSVFRELKQRDSEINMNDPRVLQALAATKLEEAKENILKESGLDDFQDSSQKILQAAVQKYSKDMNFSQQMMELEMKQQKSIEMSMINPDQDLDAFYNEPMPVAQQPMFPGLHSQRRKQQQPTRANPPSLKPQEPSPEIVPDTQTKDTSSAQRENSELFQTVVETSSVPKEEEEQKVQEVSEKSAVRIGYTTQDATQDVQIIHSCERIPAEKEQTEIINEGPSNPEVANQVIDVALADQSGSAERIPEPVSEENKDAVSLQD